MVRIHLLPPETARLIAAGEVIDRPASALRELIDNSIDAGAKEISVTLEKGGIDMLRVSDDGSGMSKEDLALSILEHATSKIESADDLLVANTLGFRGEALASIAAVARLEISSREEGSDVGWRLRKEPGKDSSMEAIPARRGTTVTIQGIFERFPARRQFLKRPNSEAALCRQIFVERAIAHPSIAFVWVSGGGESEHFPPGELAERIALLYRELPTSILSLFETEAAGAKIRVVYADPSFHRKDRKYLQVFVNRRKVPEWGFLGMLEYAFSDYLPGGMKPCAFLFAEIDPSQADFNIHPAKREVRIKNPEPIKSAFYSAFKAHLHAFLGAGPTDMWANRATAGSLPGIAPEAGPRGYYEPSTPHAGIESAFWDRLASARKEADGSWARETPASPSQESPPTAPSFRYLGKAFGPFLVFEKDSELFILDQHAAHERILYDELSASRSSSQALLVPFVFESDDEGALRRVENALPDLTRVGYDINRSGDTFIVNAVPAFLADKALPAFVDCFGEKIDKSRAGDDFIATMACRAAVKDGDSLDDFSARELIAKALALPFPRCPHGRPIWARFDKAALYRMVGRITS